MICNNCGANVANGLRECEFCGSPVNVLESGVRTTSTTQSFISLLSVEEKQILLSYMTMCNHAAAQRFIMNAFGLNGQQAYEVIKQLAEYNEAIVPNVEILINNLTPKSKNVLYFDDDTEHITKVKVGAQNKYLFKLGYTSNEKVLLLYDNAIIKSGESGFTITDKGFYSSGFFLCDKAFFIPLKDIRTTRIDGNKLLINDKKVEIVLIDENDYLNICAIVSRIIRTKR